MTGRVIANSALHLRKRAAKLCLEELKEYKVHQCLHSQALLPMFAAQSVYQVPAAEIQGTQHIDSSN